MFHQQSQAIVRFAASGALGCLTGAFAPDPRALLRMRPSAASSRNARYLACAALVLTAQHIEIAAESQGRPGMPIGEVVSALLIFNGVSDFVLDLVERADAEREHGRQRHELVETKFCT